MSIPADLCHEDGKHGAAAAAAPCVVADDRGVDEEQLQQASGEHSWIAADSGAAIW